MDEVHLANLLHAAMREALRRLSSTPVEQIRRQVYRPRGEGEAYLVIETTSPSYRGKVTWREVLESAKAESARELCSFLWDHGAVKKTIYRDNGAPERDAWEEAAWFETVFYPLESVLHQAAVTELVTSGKASPWKVTNEALLNAASDIASQLCRKTRTVEAVSPIVNVVLQGIQKVEVEQGLFLYSPSDLEACSFLSRYGREYLPDDASTMWRNCFVSVKKEIESLDADSAGAGVAESLDLVKWCVLLRKGATAVAEEGPAPIRGLDGWRGKTLRRFDTIIRPRVWFPVEIDQKDAEQMTMCAKLFRAAARIAPRLNEVMWLFGRSCNASLLRDALLDAVVGLEMLLVPDKGESTYKFWLHGIAIISHETPSVFEKELKEIYRLRSAAAHGSKNDKKEFISMAPRARFLLACAVESFSKLVTEGALNAKIAAENPGRAIQEWVTGIVSKAAKMRS